MTGKAKRKIQSTSGDEPIFRLGQRRRAVLNTESNYLDFLPDDIIIHILCLLSTTTSCITDLINVSITCRKLNGLAFNSLVLSKASPKCFAISAKNWSQSSYRFLTLFVDAGNVDATYTLGMIYFYCQNYSKHGRLLLTKAASENHAPAIYTLALIYFNGNGTARNNETITAGLKLCARAAMLGHLDALLELGNCLYDGYGIAKDTGKGGRVLAEAHKRQKDGEEPHPANRFLLEWFGERGPGVVARGLRRCSNSMCGLPETKMNEYRRCSHCGKVSYCSRTCQRLHWKASHELECVHNPIWIQHAHAADNQDDEL